MGIYIPGIELQKPQLTDGPRVYSAYILMEPGGRAAIVVDNEDGFDSTEYSLVNVPPHGRLIDADALMVKLQRHREYHSDGSKSGAAISNGIGQCLDIINGKECHTIIPAEEAQQ